MASGGGGVTYHTVTPEISDPSLRADISIPMGDGGLRGADPRTFPSGQAQTQQTISPAAESSWFGFGGLAIIVVVLLIGFVAFKWLFGSNAEKPPAPAPESSLAGFAERSGNDFDDVMKRRREARAKRKKQGKNEGPQSLPTAVSGSTASEALPANVALPDHDQGLAAAPPASSGLTALPAPVSPAQAAAALPAAVVVPVAAVPSDAMPPAATELVLPPVMTAPAPPAVLAAPPAALAAPPAALAAPPTVLAALPAVVAAPPAALAAPPTVLAALPAVVAAPQPVAPYAQPTASGVTFAPTPAGQLPVGEFSVGQLPVGVRPPEQAAPPSEPPDGELDDPLVSSFYDQLQGETDLENLSI